MPEGRLRLGICGCGWVVRNCYRPALAYLQPEFEVVAVFDPDPSARRFAAEAWPLATVCDTLDALIAEHPVAVLVASPNAYHIDQALPLLEAGMSCLVEKPVVRGVSDAARLLAAVAPGATLVSGVACRYRCDTRLWLDHVKQIQPVTELEMIWTRQHGIPSAKWHLRRDQDWTGVLADLGYHLLDIAGAALHWRHDELEVLAAAATSQMHGTAAAWYGESHLISYETDDRFVATVRLGDCRLQLQVSWIDEQPGDLVRLRARSPHGEALLEGLFGFSDNRRHAGQRVVLHQYGHDKPQETSFDPGPRLQRKAFENLLRDFHHSVQEVGADTSDELRFIAVVADAMRAKCR
ncbi:Gfo/Idh/MocA family oxidoreductase [Bradyrhizobium diazoefficiens]|uniref:Gfo/Idh/MocA family protein n=1 Tax=Bradyrhizobium diazoefficiens TaxID=1355477 RepID=UPI001B8B8CDC|nr:Gfo/Idh/MocA family oxidoreductase [Bradyrhizobium diazoefficiens]MBR0865893.1 Gfo/Idh/MocA family oxidoreductase [Bradyrhizobium diazoefficiens]MBR0890423.1 Gfo/Idh/MocA family oxidoreductase [Bradyrhizobium diazoefficiens]MBR0922193.1 Gfo/Idh/MocA family oxidoreductase [Bradyrhizobium diazoefficiens]